MLSLAFLHQNICNCLFEGKSMIWDDIQKLENKKLNVTQEAQ